MTNTNHLVITSPARQRTGSKPTAGLARCKCKTALRVDGFVWRAEIGYGRVERRIEWPTVVCTCGRQYPMIREIIAHVTEHKCDARCTNAVGPNCECSCGGKNHGTGWNAINY